MTEIILPDGSVLEDDSIMPDGSVLQGSYMIENLIEEAPGQYRKGRILAIGAVLLFFVVLFYAITIVRMGD